MTPCGHCGCAWAACDTAEEASGCVQPGPEPREITVWVCDECDYWRQEKSSGVHQADNPDDPRGKMVVHPLREAEFVEVTA